MQRFHKVEMHKVCFQQSMTGYNIALHLQIPQYTYLL